MRVLMLFSIESMRAPRVGVSKVTSTCNPTRIIKTFSHCDAVKEIDKFVTIAARANAASARKKWALHLISRHAGEAGAINQDRPSAPSAPGAPGQRQPLA